MRRSEDEGKSQTLWVNQIRECPGLVEILASCASSEGGTPSRDKRLQIGGPHFPHYEDPGEAAPLPPDTRGGPCHGPLSICLPGQHWSGGRCRLPAPLGLFGAYIGLRAWQEVGPGGEAGGEMHLDLRCSPS